MPEHDPIYRYLNLTKQALRSAPVHREGGNQGGHPSSGTADLPT